MKKFIILFSVAWYVIVSFYSSILFAAPANITSQDFEVNVSSMSIFPTLPTNGLNSGIGSFMGILSRITDLLLFTIPILAAISFMIAGYFYIFSAGDSEKANKAKTIIKWNIVAILVAFFSYGIVSIVVSFFNG